MENLYDTLLTALPEKPVIIGREEAFHSVVLAPLVNIGGEPSLLFEKRASHIRQGDEICFPGGKHDLEDRGDVALTALRETEEELGIFREKIQLDRHVGSLYGALGVVVDLFVGRIDVDSLADFTPNPDEVARIFTVPLRWFRENPPEEYELEVEIHPHRIDDEGEKVPSFPARELGLPRRYWGSWAGRPHRVFAYQVEGEVIWGLTARMIRHLISHM